MRPGSLPANGRVAAVPGGAQGGFSRASEGLALDPLLILSRWSGRPLPTASRCAKMVLSESLSTI